MAKIERPPARPKGGWACDRRGPLAARLAELAALVALLVGPAAGTAAAAGAGRIEAVVIHGLERTRPEVVEAELLLGVGDSIDAVLVAESARNLRRLYFLADARLRAVATDSGAARLEVRVRELHSRALSPLAAGSVDEPSYGVVALDYNLFGRGHVGRLTAYRDAVGGNSLSLVLRVPRLGRSELAAEARVARAEEGHGLELSAARPFRTLTSRWSWAAKAADVEETQRLYAAGGSLVARYRERRRLAALRGTASLGARTKIRPGLGLEVTDQEFAAEIAPELTPHPRRRVVASAHLTLWQPRYVRVRYVRALGRIEDLQVGPWLALRLGLSHRALGADRTYPMAAAVLAPTWQLPLGAAAFASLHLSAASRLAGGDWENAVAAAQALVHVQQQGHAAALRLRAEVLVNPEDEGQLLLGVGTGLRGHRPRAQIGRRRLAANIEVRPLLWRGTWLAVAGTALADAGTAWTPGRSSPDLRAAVGVGLRLGLPQVYATPILRLDLARGFPRGVTQVAFGTGHYF